MSECTVDILRIDDKVRIHRLALVQPGREVGHFG